MFHRREFSLTGPFAMAAVGCLFKGGLSGDKSSSESSTTNTTTTQDNKVVAGDNSFVVTAGAQVGDVTVENLDADVAKNALDNMTAVAGKSLDAGVKNVAEVLDYADSNDARAFGFAKDAQEQVLDFAATQNRDLLASSDASLNRVSEAYKSASAGDTAKLQDTLTKIAIASLVTVGGVAAVYFYRKR